MDRPLKPGEWLDSMPDPLDTVEDVEEVFEMVRKKKDKLREEAIRKDPLN